jgi:hypothetical protein
MVHNVASVTTVLASLSVLATAVCAGVWWLWRRAGESARAQQRLERLEKQQAATAALLEEIRNKLERKRGRLAIFVTQELVIENMRRHDQIKNSKHSL